MQPAKAKSRSDTTSDCPSGEMRRRSRLRLPVIDELNLISREHHVDPVAVSPQNRALREVIHSDVGPLASRWHGCSEGRGRGSLNQTANSAPG